MIDLFISKIYHLNFIRINEINEINETSETNETNDMTDMSELNEMSEMNETNEPNEVNETASSPQIDSMGDTLLVIMIIYIVLLCWIGSMIIFIWKSNNPIASNIRYRLRHPIVAEHEERRRRTVRHRIIPLELPPSVPLETQTRAVFVQPDKDLVLGNAPPHSATESPPLPPRPNEAPPNPRRSHSNSQHLSLHILFPGIIVTHEDSIHHE